MVAIAAISKLVRVRVNFVVSFFSPATYLSCFLF